MKAVLGVFVFAHPCFGATANARCIESCLFSSRNTLRPTEAVEDVGGEVIHDLRLGGGETGMVEAKEAVKRGISTTESRTMASEK